MASSELESVVWILLDEAERHGFTDESTHTAVVCLDGVIGEKSSRMHSGMCFEPVVESVDIRGCHVIEGKDEAERFKDIAEEFILSLRG